MNEKLLILEKLRAGAKINIIGDSLSAGMGCSGGYDTGETLLVYGADRYTRWHAPNSWWVELQNYLAQKYPLCSLENHGCSGIYTYQLSAGLSQVVSGDEDIVLILVGVNDRKRGSDLKELEEGLDYMIGLFRSRGAVPVLMTPNPSAPKNEMQPSRLCHTEDVVNVIRYAALKNDAILADCYEAVLAYMEAHKESIEELMTQPGCESDGLHPTDRVQKIMAACVLRALGLARKVPGANW